MIPGSSLYTNCCLGDKFGRIYRLSRFRKQADIRTHPGAFKGMRAGQGRWKITTERSVRDRKTSESGTETLRPPRSFLVRIYTDEWFKFGIFCRRGKQSM